LLDKYVGYIDGKPVVIIGGDKGGSVSLKVFKPF